MSEQNFPNEQVAVTTQPEVKSSQNYKPYFYTAIVALIVVGGLGYYLMPTQPSYEVQGIPDVATNSGYIQDNTVENQSVVNNWKTYKDASYKFSIQYPSEWIFTPNTFHPDKDFFYMGFGPEESVTTKPLVVLRIYTAGHGQLVVRDNLEKIIVDGVEGKMFKSTTQSGKPYVMIGFSKNGYQYELEATGFSEGEKTVNTVLEMISHFKFEDTSISNTPTSIACTMDAMMCPDGSYVGRSGPNCEFICPTQISNMPQTQPVEWLVYSGVTSQGIVADTSKDLWRTSVEIINLLSAKDYAKLEAMVSSAGLSVNDNPSLDLTKHHISKENISEIPYDSTTMLWGYEDGRGDPINVTTQAFIEQYVFSKNFLMTDSINVNRIKDGGTNNANTLLQDISGRNFVAFYYQGDPQYPGMTWMTLYLIFDVENGAYKLRGITRNQWTI